MAEHEGEGNAVVLSLQPMPKAVRVSHFQSQQGWVTAISRDWAPGDGERCKLCPVDHCELDSRGKNCLRQFEGFVQPESAPLFADPLPSGNNRPGFGIHIKSV